MSHVRDQNARTILGYRVGPEEVAYYEKHNRPLWRGAQALADLIALSSDASVGESDLAEKNAELTRLLGEAIDVIRIKYGNLHEDVNSFLARANSELSRKG